MELAHTLVPYEPQPMGLEDMVGEVIGVMDPDGRMDVRIVSPGDGTKQLSVGHLSQRSTGEITFAPDGAVVAQGNLPEVIQIASRTYEAALKEITAHTFQASKDRQRLPPDTLAALMAGHLRDMNKLACNTGLLNVYTEVLATTWGTLIAEDVKNEPEAIAAHITEFTKAALGYAQKVAQDHARQRAFADMLERLPRLPPMAIKEVVDRLHKLAQADAEQEPVSGQTH